MWYLKGRIGNEDIFMHVESAQLGELNSELCNLTNFVNADYKSPVGRICERH
jgi:hypothetical protein